MKHKAIKKATSCVLAAALTFSCASYFAVQQSGEVQAATNTWYEEKTSLQPYGTCLYMDQLRNWTPDADPDARYNMGNIELKERFNGPLVNDNALTDPKLMLLAMVNPRCSTAKSLGGDEISVYAPTNLQYADSLNYWGGSVAEGIIAIPTPEAIDMAHKNGVKSTGTIFFPWGGDGNPEWVKQMCEKAPDGSFPMADKLIEIAEYYGFDGFFVNGETSCSAVAGTIVEFCKYVQKKKPDNFILQWYDALTPSGSVWNQDAVTSSNVGIIQDGDERVTDQFFLNFNWGSKRTIDSSIKQIESVGRSQWDIFATWENTPGGGTHYPNDRWKQIVDENGKAKTSIGILAPQDTLYKSTSPEDFMNNTDVKLFSGPAMDPSNTSATGNWPGIAHFIADHSTITGDSFVTRFNSGNGYNFYKDGAIVRAGEWYNRSEMDIMPTWRWIVESEGSKLTPTVDFQDAYYGGTSMNIAGKLDAGKANHIKLYSTKLDMKDSTKVRVAYKTDAENSNMQVGLCFGDSYDESNFVFYDVPAGVDANNGWKVAEIDVSDQAGKQAIALSLRFASDVDADMNINVGELAVVNTANEKELPAPDVTLDEALFEDYSNAEARIYWNEVDGATNYEIYRVKADGSKEFMGSTPGTAYYLSRFYRDGDEQSFDIQVVPVNETGKRGNAGVLTFDWSIPAGTAETVDRSEPENLALKKPIWSNKTNDDIIKLNDGVITSSKWCVDGRASESNPHIATIDMGEPTSISRWKVWHANCPGAGESPDMNTVDFKLRYSNDNSTWTDADVVVGNREDITDRNLEEPITARYWQLYVTNGDRSPWTATRIYEWEMFADKHYERSEAISMANVYALNHEGAADELVIVNATPGDTVHLFKDLTTTDILASATVNSDGTVTFTGLDFGAESGRIYYSSKSASAAYDSVRRSVAYEAEAGDRTAVPADADISYVPSTKGSINLSNTEYGILTLKGLEVGTVARIYDSADAKLPILTSAPVTEGNDSLVQERIPMPKGAQTGTIYVEVQAPGLRSTERIALSYDKANVDTLAQAVAEAQAIDTSKYTTTSVKALTAALAQAEAAKNDISVGSTAAVQALEDAIAGLVERANTKVLEDLIAYAEKIKAEGALDNCVDYVTEGFNNALQEAKDLVASGDAQYQDMIDASNKLLKFIGMVEFKQGDKTALQIAVEIANKINENLDLYINTAEFTAALTAAQNTLEDGNAMQEDVDKAYDALLKAMLELRMKPNKDILNEMIKDTSSMDLSVYTTESANTLKAALAAAEEIAAKEDATQDEVDSAVEALRAAQAGLVKNNGTADNDATDIPNAGGDKAPVQDAGEGSAPTKTGDAGSLAVLGVMSMAAAAVVLLKKKKN